MQREESYKEEERGARVRTKRLKDKRSARERRPEAVECYGRELSAVIYTTTTHERICEKFKREERRRTTRDTRMIDLSLSTSDLVVGEKDAKRESGAAAHSVRVRLSSASLFLPIASSRCATLSRSLGAPARSRDTAPFITREASPPISRREIPYGKNIWRRETATRAQSSSGGTRRERNCERNPTLKERMNREPTACLRVHEIFERRL